MLSSAISGKAAIASAVCVVEPWPACTSSPRRRGQSRAVADPLPFGLRRRSAYRSATASHQAPVWISITGAPIAAAASICCGSAAMNSETRMPASLSLRHSDASWIVLAGDVEAAFGGALLAPLRHEAGRVRPGRERDGDHLVGRRHLEVERHGDLALQPRDVVVADVAAVLAQVRGDAVGAGRDRHHGRAHRIGMPSAARVADGRDVVDVDAEAQCGDAITRRVAAVRTASSA